MSFVLVLHFNRDTSLSPKVRLLYKGPAVANLLTVARAGGIPVRVAAWGEPFSLVGLVEGQEIPATRLNWVVGIYRTLPIFRRQVEDHAIRSLKNNRPSVFHYSPLWNPLFNAVPLTEAANHLLLLFNA
jgi:hypothetical protein